MNADEMMYELGLKKWKIIAIKLNWCINATLKMNIGEYFSSNRMGLEM